MSKLVREGHLSIPEEIGVNPQPALAYGHEQRIYWSLLVRAYSSQGQIAKPSRRKLYEVSSWQVTKTFKVFCGLYAYFRFRSLIWYHHSEIPPV